MIDEKLVEMMTRALSIQRVATMLAESAPDAAAGEDSSQSVQVEILKNAELGRVQIATDWRKRLRGRPLGEAVTQAVQQAYAERATAMSASRTSFTPPRVTREEALAALADARGRQSPATDSTVDPVDLAEGFLARDTPAPEPAATDAAVIVTTSSGMITAVTIDENWAVGQTPFGLAAGIMDAARRAPAAASDPLAGMFQAALAAITHAGH